MAVLSRVVSDLPLLQALEPDLSINLNLSPQDLKSENFDVAMSRMLQQSGVPAHRIKLAITERALVNSEIAHLLVQKFRARGPKVAIADFGPGYRSEERRAGEECVSTVRTRGSAKHSKKKI